MPMTCPQCNSSIPESARFCHRCGAVVDARLSRSHHYAAHPDEPVRALALLSTLMPHLSGHHRHAYRQALGIAFVATIIAAAFGALAVALFCASVALPVLLLLYLHDHDVWEDEPVIAITLGVIVAIGMGIGVGFLANAFSNSSLSSLVLRSLPSAGTVLATGLLVPIVVFVALSIVTGALTSRPSFSHAVDAVNFGAAAAAALALGESLTVQHGAFSGIALTSTDPATDAFIALTLGFAKPIIYAGAAALPWLARQRHGWSPRVVQGAVAGLILVVLYHLGSTLLNPYGTRGVVLTFLVAVVLASVAILILRTSLHVALLDEANATVLAGASPKRRAAEGSPCAHCGLMLLEDASFCVACGTAVATFPKQTHTTNPAGGTAGAPAT
jgi:zinc-ribbon domain